MPKYTEQFVQQLCKRVVEGARKEEFVIPFSVKLIANMREAITKDVVPATHLLVGSSVWVTMIADPAMQILMDVVSEKETIYTGRVAVLFGMDVLTDSFFNPEEHYLPKNFCSVASVQVDELNVVKALTAYID